MESERLQKPGAVPLSVRISTLLQPKGPTVVTRAHGDQEIPTCTENNYKSLHLINSERFQQHNHSLRALSNLHPL